MTMIQMCLGSRGHQEGIRELEPSAIQVIVGLLSMRTSLMHKKVPAKKKTQKTAARTTARSTTMPYHKKVSKAKRASRVIRAKRIRKASQSLGSISTRKRK